MLNKVFPKIHSEGYKFLAIAILATFIILFFSKFLGFISILITTWVYYFFRDPERYSINDDSFLVSPADGLITDISERAGPEELRLENTTYTRVSIFMNVFNCHVNRTPTTGKVEEIIRGGETSLDWDGVFARRVLLLVFGIQRRIFTPETRTTFRTASARGTERIFNTD